MSQPGLIQDATRAMVRSLPGVSLVATTSGALSATALVPQLQPDLLLIDANLPEEEVRALLRWTQDHYPEIRSVVMTKTSRQRAEVLTWGAHAAILRASLGEQLEAALSQTPQVIGPESHV